MTFFSSKIVILDCQKAIFAKKTLDYETFDCYNRMVTKNKEEIYDKRKNGDIPR